MFKGLYLKEGILLQYLQKDVELDISRRINKKAFRISFTQMSYRQINSLGSDNLLNDKRRNVKKWRKFSFKELVYLLVVKQLKSYGVNGAKLRDLWSSFFENPEGIEDGSTDINGRPAEVVIGCVLMGVEVFLTVDSDGSMAFYDPTYFAIPIEEDCSHIYVNMNKIVNEVITTMHRKPLPVTHSFFNEFLRQSLTEKEQKLLTIIRNGEYSSIRVKKRNGDIATVHAEYVNSDSIGMKEVDILRGVENKDFVNVDIVKRDGRVVNYRIEDQFKL